jgi:RNA polymerase sigma-70 factor (ECF subfamily)
MTEFDENVHAGQSATPETAAVAANQRDHLMRALESLPARSREVLVLRELEGCSYKEIGEITGIPIGTVMSSLARARERLQRAAQGMGGVGGGASVGQKKVYRDV